MADGFQETQVDTVIETEQPDVLEMSDEDFANEPEPSPVLAEEGETEEVPEPETEDEPELVETSVTVKETKEEDSADEIETPVESKADLDYATEYKKLMAPFKANGTDIQVKSVDDAIQLMKMGAGFHKKMAALKPNLKQMKLLEKNGLLDDEKLNYIIDLYNKVPEAVTKLLKDAQIDPLDIDIQAESNYKPTNRRVSDRELLLDNVLDEIRETPTFQKTLTVVSQEWDDASQNVIASEPHIISIINGHIADGTFDKVMEKVTYERSLGRLTELSDFDAYKEAGNALAQAGVLQVPGTPQTSQSVPPPGAKTSQKELERKHNKRAASPTKGAKATTVPAFDPLDLSDADFAKLDINQYIK